MNLELHPLPHPPGPDNPWVRPAAYLLARELFNRPETLVPEAELDMLQNPADSISQYCLSSEDRLLAVVRLSSVSRATLAASNAYALKHVAIDREYQGQGVGAFMLWCMEREAAERGAPELHVYPRLDARNFYIRHHYRPHHMNRTYLTKPLVAAKYQAEMSPPVLKGARATVVRHAGPLAA